jgi:hypothetical protein
MEPSYTLSRNPVDEFSPVREAAFRLVEPARLASTNLHLDRRLREEGELLGPEFQQLRAPRTSVLVFVDDQPDANFGHACRYLLFNPETSALHTTFAARFPPWQERIPESFETFHRPVHPLPMEALFHVIPAWHCPIFFPRGNRYAIFYSGMSNTRHLNDMEFGYRTLIHRYRFRPENITVLSYDGTTDTQEGTNITWPGDGTHYQIRINGAGDQAALEAAVDELKVKLRPQDVLFVHTNNHGDNDSGGSFLCEYPNWGKYYANDFAMKLGELPHYRSLVVMMEQCNAGGFNQPIITHSTASATSVASAAIASQSSYVSSDGHWDPFARDWFAAQAGHTPYGAALAFNADSNGNGRIEATEAFGYANTVRDPRDSPNFDQSSAAGGAAWLGQEYFVWWWWCFILRTELQARYLELPEEAYAERFREVEPRLLELTEKIDANSEELRREISVEVQTLVEQVYGPK